jgi:UDP-glucose 4-epimerase
MRVLVTGGAGFIGSYLVEALVGRGDSVTVLDNCSTGKQDNLNGVKDKINFTHGDIRNRDLIESLTEKTDLIFHLAAALGVNTILESTLESISTNIVGSEVVLTSAAKYKKRILIASTSEIYGKNPKQPLSELDDRVIGAPQMIRWSYSDAKAIEEAVATTLFQRQALPVTTVRLFNTVGPRQSGSYGMVLPRLVDMALKGDPLTVYGDGTQTRVFCHVSDAVRGLLALTDSQKTIGDVFNLGGQGEISIRDLAKKVIAATGSKSKIEMVDYKIAYPAGFEDMQRRVPNVSKIKSVIGWQPQHDIDSIIADVVAYFKTLSTP